MLAIIRAHLTAVLSCFTFHEEHNFISIKSGDQKQYQPLVHYGKTNQLHNLYIPVYMRLKLREKERQHISSFSGETELPGCSGELHTLSSRSYRMMVYHPSLPDQTPDSRLPMTWVKSSELQTCIHR